jgi:hypothetical protein
MLTRTFTPTLERLEGREAPAGLGGALSGLSNLTYPALDVSRPISLTLVSTSFSVEMQTKPAPSNGHSHQEVMTITLSTLSLSIPSLTTPIETFTSLTVQETIKPSSPVVSLPSSSVTSTSPVTSPVDEVGPFASFSSALAVAVPQVSTPTTSGTTTAATSASIAAPAAQQAATSTAATLSQASASQATTLQANAVLLANAFSSALNGSTLTAATFSNQLPAATPANLAVTGAVRLGDSLTAVGRVGGTLSGTLTPAQISQQPEIGPRINTPNSGSGDSQERLPAPTPNVQERQQNGEAPGPLLPDLEDAEPVLNFQVGRFDNWTEQDSASQNGEDGVDHPGLPWWTLGLLASGGLAVTSLATQPEERRRKDLLAGR